jgi:hypothetical protein
MGNMRDAYKICIGKPEGKRPRGIPRLRWEDIRMDLREIGWEGVKWIHLAQDSEHGNEPSGSLRGRE